MLQMAVDWRDLERIALKPHDLDLSTPYWKSTLEIGRQVIKTISAIFSELGTQGTLAGPDHQNTQDHRLPERSAERARELLAESPLVATLLAE
jgi:hypothetical protein